MDWTLARWAAFVPVEPFPEVRDLPDVDLIAEVSPVDQTDPCATLQATQMGVHPCSVRAAFDFALPDSPLLERMQCCFAFGAYGRDSAVLPVPIIVDAVGKIGIAFAFEKLSRRPRKH